MGLRSDPATGIMRWIVFYGVGGTCGFGGLELITSCGQTSLCVPD